MLHAGLIEWWPSRKLLHFAFLISWKFPSQFFHGCLEERSRNMPVYCPGGHMLFDTLKSDISTHLMYSSGTKYIENYQKTRNWWITKTGAQGSVATTKLWWPQLHNLLYNANWSLNFPASGFRPSKLTELGILHLQLPNCEEEWVTRISPILADVWWYLNCQF